MKTCIPIIIITPWGFIQALKQYRKRKNVLIVCNSIQKKCLMILGVKKRDIIGRLKFQSLNLNGCIRNSIKILTRNNLVIDNILVALSGMRWIYRKRCNSLLEKEIPLESEGSFLWKCVII